MAKGVKRGPNGGKRPGAGRPKGARDKFNVELHKRLVGTEDDPANVLIGLMRESEDESIRLRAAQSLMPHIYPKLTSTEFKGEIAAAIKSIETRIVDPKGEYGEPEADAG